MTLRTTIAALKPALSRMPMTRTTVMKSTTSAAGRLQYAPVAVHRCVIWSMSMGVFVQRSGMVTPKMFRKEIG